MDQSLAACGTAVERPTQVLADRVTRAYEWIGPAPGNEVDLLLALSAGPPGNVNDPKANSAREALVETCTLPLLAGENISKLSEFRCVQGTHLTFRLRMLEPVRS